MLCWPAINSNYCVIEEIRTRYVTMANLPCNFINYCLALNVEIILIYYLPLLELLKRRPFLISLTQNNRYTWFILKL